MCEDGGMKSRKSHSTESRYVEFDEDTGYWSIFGEDTGFCFGQYNSKEEAEHAMREQSP